jgi:hypothetical protein
MIGPRKVDKPLVIYGYGKLGHLAEEVFNELGIPIAAKIDRTTWAGKLVKDALVAVCVATEPFEHIKESLQGLEFTDIVPVWDIIEAYPEVGLGNGWFAGENSMEDHIGIRAVRFEDELSEQHYYWGHVQWRRYRNETLVVPSGDNISLPSTLADIRARQRVVIYDRPQEVVSIHAEGLEMDTLIANMGYLACYRPKIEVACYHSRDGLWKIEKYLMDNLKNYTWTFRLHTYQGQSAYIYGVPKEREGL